MPETQSTWLLSNWSFWAVLVAAAALILSQLPPLKYLLRRTRLRVEPYDRINVTHWLGNPIVNHHLLLTNNGGRQVRVTDLELEIRPDGKTNFLLPGRSISHPDRATVSLLLVPFTLAPGQEWRFFVSFSAAFSTPDEQNSKRLMKELRSDIGAKLQARTPEQIQSNTLVMADPKFVTPLLDFYKLNNKWQTGEYTAELSIKCDPSRASVSQKFRFTLYEADCSEMEERTQRYKFGFGVYDPDTGLTDIYPPIKHVS